MKVKINGIQMGYDDIGHEGPTIVLIHGFGLNRNIWRELAETYLSPQRVILPDVRGHGESEAPEGPYPMTLLAEDILALLDFLKVEKPMICGHSMGGYITLAFAEKYPERIAGMGLIATHAKADPPEKKADRYQMVEDVGEQGAVVLAKSLAPKLTKDEGVLEQTYEILANTNPMGIIGVLQGMAERPDRTELLTNVRIPVLVLAGEEDQLIDAEDARKMSMTIPNSKFFLASGAGHMPMVENTNAVAKGLGWLISQFKTAQGQAD